MWELSVTALLVGSFSVLCSAWFRTTAAAFLATYLLGAIAFVCMRPFILFSPVNNTITALAVPGRQTFIDCVVGTIPQVGISLLIMTVARYILWKRAFVKPKSFMLRLFRSLDLFFHWANNNQFTRGIIVIKESVVLPHYHPISWRETSKRSLGTTRYLIRFLLLLEVPVLFMILWPASEQSIRSGYAPAFVSGWILWIVATLVLSIQATGLIGTERSHQSLDVLLTTPIESDEIVRQKFAGIWRMTRMLWVPFATLYLFQMWWEAWVTTFSGYYHPHSNHVMFVFFRAVLSVGLYLPLIAWFGFYQGLRSRSQTQAILTTMTVITVICVAPMMVAWFLTPVPQIGRYMGPPAAPVVNWISPAYVLSVIATTEFDWLLLFFHFAAVAIAYVLLSLYARKSFARQVGRNDGFDDDFTLHSVEALSFEERMARLRRRVRGGSADYSE